MSSAKPQAAPESSDLEWILVELGLRLYREEKLAVRRRGGRKWAIGTRAPMLVPLGPNERWSLDFVFDQFTDGRRFRDPGHRG